MSGPTPRRLWQYVTQRLGLAAYFEVPGDGRQAPQIPAQALLWGLVIGHVLREDAFAGVEALVRSAARRARRVARGFSDDTLAYFTERLDPGPTRAALVGVLRRAKRNKAFGGEGWIGLAVDGTTTTCCAKKRCRFCRPLPNEAGEILGYRHHVVLISVVGTGLPVPCDVEPYGPGDSEEAAAQRLLRRVVRQLGPRFADYVVADGKFATAPFLHTVGELGLRAVIRLKDNLPALLEAAQQRYAGQLPTETFAEERDHVEVGMRGTLILGARCAGRPCGCCGTGRPNRPGGSWRRCGLPIGRCARCPVAPSTGWRRVAGKSKTKGLTRPSRATGWSTSAIITRTASWWAG